MQGIRKPAAINSSHLPRNPPSFSSKPTPVESHYSWIPYLQIHLLSKMYLWPQSQHLRFFCNHSRTCARWWKIWDTRHTHPWVRSNKAAFQLLVSVPHCEQDFLQPVCATFSHFHSFCWWFDCLKCPQHIPEVLSIVPICKNAVCPTEKIHAG